MRFNKSVVNNLIIGCGLPISIVDNPKFEAFVCDMNPKYSLPFRSHVTGKLIPACRKARVDGMKAHLASACYLSLTVVIWTDRRMHSYLAITAHTFVDCVAKSMLRHFTAFKGSHTGVHIAKKIEKAISDNGLIGKIVYIVTDNASNMRKACNIVAVNELESEKQSSEDIPSHSGDVNIDTSLAEDPVLEVWARLLYSQCKSDSLEQLFPPVFCCR
jgi:hypothetical protein